MSVMVLDSDTASYTNGDVSVKDNPWNKGSLVRDVNYTEIITLETNSFPNNTLISWTWPAGGISGLYSYPLLEKALSPQSAINSYSKLFTTFDYSAFGYDNDPTDPNSLPFNVLHEAWLSSSGNQIEVMVQLTPRRVLPRTDSHPFISINASTLGINQSFDVESWTDSWKKILCYPTTHMRTVAEDSRFSNPTLSGSINGTPGTDPTGCEFSTVSGVTKSIVASGTTTAADGNTVNYVDVRFYGTPTANGTIACKFYVDGASYVKTSPSQDWLISVYLAVLSAGTGTTNIGEIQISAAFLDNPVTTYMGGGATISLTSALTTSPQNFALQSFMPWNNAPFIGNLAPLIIMGVTAGQAIDITLRIASPLISWDSKLILTQGKFDWKALFAALVSAGLLSGAELLTEIQFGPETNGGNGSLAIRTYSVDVNGAV
jgi:hypothetical protein